MKFTEWKSILTVNFAVQACEDAEEALIQHATQVQRWVGIVDQVNHKVSLYADSCSRKKVSSTVSEKWQMEGQIYCIGYTRCDPKVNTPLFFLSK